MWIGCYTLHLYCENYDVRDLAPHEYDEFPHEYADEFGSRCRTAARRDGWTLKTDGKAICPKCRKSGFQEGRHPNGTTL